MECINCTQCIDACNDVMAKIGREPNLIRYSSQAHDAGQTSGFMRARTIIYPVLIAGIITAFLTVFLSSKTFDAVLLREPGNPHTLTNDGLVRNILKLKITNRTDEEMSFASRVIQPELAKLKLRENEFVVAANESKTFHIEILAPRDVFDIGRAPAQLKVSNAQDVSRILKFKLIGPYN